MKLYFNTKTGKICHVMDILESEHFSNENRIGFQIDFFNSKRIFIFCKALQERFNWLFGAGSLV